jgi:hypothetical protein
LQNLRALQRLLDSAFRVPGTNIHFGWDALIGLVPWAGDGITALLSFAFLAEAWRMRLPRIIQSRMLLNVVIDVVLGFVPFAGDVADVFWRSNARNLALLERHAHQPQPPRASDWLFVMSILLAMAAIVVVPFLVLYWFVHFLGRTLV